MAKFWNDIKNMLAQTSRVFARRQRCRDVQKPIPDHRQLTQTWPLSAQTQALPDQDYPQKSLQRLITTLQMCPIPAICAKDPVGAYLLRELCRHRDYPASDQMQRSTFPASLSLTDIVYYSYPNTFNKIKLQRLFYAKR